MQFSAKISHAFINFGVKNQIDVMDMLDRSNLAFEVASNPEAWLPCQNVESFLALFAEDFSSKTQGHLIRDVGHQAPELKAWGVLDGVLKMMRSPKDLYLQPNRFLSYFISPAPPVQVQKSSANSIAFDVPLFFDEYPNTCLYLQSCLEALGLYAQQSLADAKWQENTISISWSEHQSSLLKEEPYYFNPELVQSIIETVENNQVTIENLRQNLKEKETELARLKEIENLGAEQTSWTSHDRNWFESEVLKLQDYFSRAQQLVTILVGSDRKSKLVKEAMKKVRWNNVPEAFPETIEKLRQRLRNNAPIKKDEPEDTQFRLELQ